MAPSVLCMGDYSDLRKCKQVQMIYVEDLCTGDDPDLCNLSAAPASRLAVAPLIIFM